MSIDNPRPGSMLAADRKQEKNIVIIFSAIFLVVYLFIWFPIGGDWNYFHKYFVRAATWCKVVGFILAIAHAWFMWKKFRSLQPGIGDKGTPGLLLFGSYALILGFFFGFDLSLAGIEPGVTN